MADDHFIDYYELMQLSPISEENLPSYTSLHRLPQPVEAGEIEPIQVEVGGSPPRDNTQ